MPFVKAFKKIFAKCFVYQIYPLALMYETISTLFQTKNITMFSLNTSAKKIALLAFFPWFLGGIGNSVMAQETPKTDKKSETQEIIIKKKGDKNATLKLEFSDNKVLINGKPLVEFNDDEISINNRKIIINGKKIERDVEDMLNSFDFFDDNEFSGKMQGTDGKAFLGVTTVEDKSGAKISTVTAKSAASEAGLQKDDIITKIDKEKIILNDDLSKSIISKKPGDKVKITYLRNGKTKTADATLQKANNSMVLKFSTPFKGSKSLTVPGRPMLPPGVSTEEFMLNNRNGINRFNYPFIKTPKMGIKIMDIENGKGVKILDVEAGSMAATAGMQKDDILISMNGKNIDNTDMAREVMHDNVDEVTYPAIVKRNGKEVTLTIKVPKEIKTIDL